MPLYDFICAACSHRFEAFLRSGETSAPCPECECGGVTRMPALPSSCGHNTMKNPAIKEEKRKEGKRERMETFYKNEGKWGKH
jgi:putative FmdB family regulatory protein